MRACAMSASPTRMRICSERSFHVRGAGAPLPLPCRHETRRAGDRDSANRVACHGPMRLRHVTSGRRGTCRIGPGWVARPAALAAKQEDRAMTMTSVLRVGDVMSFNPVVVSPDDTVAEAERLIKTYRVSGLPVVEDGVAVGVVSQTDLAVAHSSELISSNWSRLLVRHLMSTPAVTVHLGTSIEHAGRQMLTRHIHRLVVVDDDDRAIGVVSSLDLLRTIV